MKHTQTFEEWLREELGRYHQGEALERAVQTIFSFPRRLKEWRSRYDRYCRRLWLASLSPEQLLDWIEEVVSYEGEYEDILSEIAEVLRLRKEAKHLAFMQLDEASPC